MFTDLYAFIIHRSTVPASSNETPSSTPADSNVSTVPVFYPYKGMWLLVHYT